MGLLNLRSKISGRQQMSADGSFTWLEYHCTYSLLSFITCNSFVVLGAGIHVGFWKWILTVYSRFFNFAKTVCHFETKLKVKIYHNLVIILHQSGFPKKDTNSFKCLTLLKCNPFKTVFSTSQLFFCHKQICKSFK